MSIAPTPGGRRRAVLPPVVVPPSPSPAAHTILPWLRRGAASWIGGTGAPPDPPNSAPRDWHGPRVILKTTVSFNAGAHSASVDLPLVGTGEITGFDANAIIRTSPARDAADAEPDLLACIEFDQPDLPWRYTPVAANLDDRLDPWLALLVLETNEIQEYQPPRSSGVLPSIAIRAGVLLPDLAESWAWAHVQISGSVDDKTALLPIIRTSPQNVVARLLCPRRLQQRRDYRAFLVPAFERGRRAGLGEPVGDDVDALLPAWRFGKHDSAVTLPVYYEWAFRTASGASDFESMVMRMTAQPLPPTVGTRAVDMSAVERALPPASAAPLRIEGALKAPDAPPPAWDDSERKPFVDALTDLLNVPKALLQGKIPTRFAPPLYGRWLAAADAAGEPTTPRWLDTLNRDPRLRIAAGAGAAVVADNEEALLAAAWRQIDGLLDINETLRLAQLARELAMRLRDRRLTPLDLESFLFLTSPVFRRVRDGVLTIASVVAVSPIGRGPFEPAFRRVLRRFVKSPTTVLAKMNADRRPLIPAPPPSLPSFVAAAGVDATIAAVAPRPSFALASEVGPGHPPPAFGDPGSGGADSAAAAQFRAAIAKTLDGFHAPTFPEPAQLSIDLAATRLTLAAALDPVVVVADGVVKRLHVAPGLARNVSDPLEPILYEPEIDAAMFAPLRDLSPEWILPSLGDLPENSISLAAVNQPFIEAFLTGLNHELTRVLLARDYPADQRGTHVRQFWDPSGYFGPHPREELRDIKPITSWPSTNDLGANGVRAGAPLVLILRGDLLRQYPTAIVYAVRAKSGDLSTEERHPLFRGTLGGDLAFFAFELTAAEARGGGGDEGWFFVLQEQPSEPRFGLAAGAAGTPPPARWSDLTWAHFNAIFDFIRLNDALPDTSGIAPTTPSLAWHPGNSATSAQIATILQRQPKRIAVHAAMLLGGK